MNRNGKIIGSIVLFCIGGFFLLGGIGSMVDAVNMASYSVRSYCTAELIEAEAVAEEEIAEEERKYLEEDYILYRLTFRVENHSSEEHSYEAPTFYFEGEEYDDVQPWEPGIRETEEGLFGYESRPYLPGGQSLETAEYVLVERGVREIALSYSPDYEEEEILTIALPQ